MSLDLRLCGVGSWRTRHAPVSARRLSTSAILSGSRPMDWSLEFAKAVTSVSDAWRLLDGDLNSPPPLIVVGVFSPRLRNIAGVVIVFSSVGMRVFENVIMGRER